MSTIVNLIPGVSLGTTPGTLYTSPSGITTLIKHLVVANISGAAALVTLSILRSGAGTPVTITPGVSLAASAAPYIAAELVNEVLAPGDALQGSASVAAVLNVIASGIQL